MLKNADDSFLIASITSNFIPEHRTSIDYFVY